MFALSVRDVKVLLNIQSTQFDDYIETMLPITIALTEKHCNNELAIRNTNGAFLKTNEGYMLNDMGLKILLAKIIEFYLTKTSVTYEAVGRITQTYATELPKAILDGLKPYSKGRIKFL